MDPETQAERAEDVPPGPCMSALPMLGSGGVTALCELRSGHAGGHECGSAQWIDRNHPQFRITRALDRHWQRSDGACAEDAYPWPCRTVAILTGADE